jgi:hypothetical protein
MGWFQIPSDAGELMPILDELRKRDACGFAVAKAIVALTAINWDDIPTLPDTSGSVASEAAEAGEWRFVTEEGLPYVKSPEGILWRADEVGFAIESLPSATEAGEGAGV